MPSNRSPENFRLVEQDCIAGMQEMAAQSVDVIVTSPPYNLGIDYGKYEDQLSADDYLAWTTSWIAAAARALKDNGSLFLNLGACPSNPLMPFQVVVETAKQLRLQNTFHWIKSISVETRKGEVISAGHFKPINSERFVTDCHEYIFHFTKRGDVPLKRLNIGVPYQDKSNIARWKHTKGTDKRCRGNTWFVPYKTIRYRIKDRPHPATFPVQLAKNCILLHGAGGKSRVMDPFVGLGSSAVAAFECGVGSFVGFDVDLEYLRLARERLQQCGQTTLSFDFGDIPGGAKPGAVSERTTKRRSKMVDRLVKVG